MKSAALVAGAVSLALIACNDIPQAPPEVVPTAPTVTKIRIDSQFYADYSNAIVYPSLVLSGTTTFGLTYGLWEAGRYRFAGCPIGCEERRNWVVGDPDTTAGVTATIARQPPPMSGCRRPTSCGRVARMQCLSTLRASPSANEAPVGP